MTDPVLEEQALEEQALEEQALEEQALEERVLGERVLWEKAASCYEAAGELVESARCYHRAGAHHRAADVYLRLGRHEAAAQEYAAARYFDDAAWILANHVSDPAAARAMVAAASHQPDPVPLLRRLVLARCEIAETRCDIAQTPAQDGVLSLLAEVQEALAGHGPPVPASLLRVEQWSVIIAATMRRYDQVALIYAAAVRGRRPDAAARWRTWAAAHLGAPLVLPEPAIEPVPEA